MQTQTIEPTVIDPEAVAAFYRRRPGTEEAVRQTVKIVQEEFAEIESITLKAVRDPEEPTECIVITVTARLKADDLKAAYSRSLRRANAETPPDTWQFVVLQRRES